jgi:Tol biopolymer transport system component
MKTKTHILALVLIVLFSSCNNEEVSGPSGNVEYSQIDFDAAWSSSGTMIAFSHNDLEFDLSGIYTMDSSGSNKVQRVFGNASNPDWSPLDTAIIYEQGGALMILNLGSGISRIFASGNGIGKASWNKVNGKVAWVNGNFLYVTDSDASNLIVVNVNCSWSDWSPDGRYLYYFEPLNLSGGVRGGDALVKFDLLNLSNSLIRNFASDSYLDNSHLSVSATEIYFSSTFGNGSSYVYKFEESSSDSERVVNDLSFSPNFDPVSGRLLYTNRTRGDGRLWILEANGSSRKLTY